MGRQLSRKMFIRFIIINPIIYIYTFTYTYIYISLLYPHLWIFMVGFKPISHLCSPSPHFWLLKSELYEDFGVFELPFWVQIPKIHQVLRGPGAAGQAKEELALAKLMAPAMFQSLENDSGDTETVVVRRCLIYIYIITHW
jgi:hypothetical protein